MPSTPETIDDVIRELTDIIEQSKATAHRMGYFAALYRKVTVAVKEKLGTGYFDDDDRLEKLDVIFAGRYLTAVEQYQTQEHPTQSWQFAFDVTTQYWPIVLQHLLLGINAHINLDLGIASAETAESSAALQDLRRDFDKINALLATLVGEVKEELAAIWTTLRWFNRYLGDIEDAIINFSIDKARDHAWSVAETVVALAPADRAATIERFDSETLALAHLIRHPGFLLSSTNRMIRLGERGSVPWIIGQLE